MATYLIVRISFENKYCNLLTTEKEYESFDNKILAIYKYIGICGCEFFVSYKTFKKNRKIDRICQKHQTEQNRLLEAPKKYEHMVKVFYDDGCRLVTSFDEYCSLCLNTQNYFIEVAYIARCGCKHEVQYGSFKNSTFGRMCQLCNVENKKLNNSEDKFLEFTAYLKNNNCVMVTKLEEFREACLTTHPQEIKLRYIAQCGCERECDFEHFKLREQGRNCNACSEKARKLDRAKEKYYEIKNFCKSVNCRLLNTKEYYIDNVYSTNSVVIEYETICGHFNATVYEYFKAGSCRLCWDCIRYNVSESHKERLSGDDKHFNLEVEKLGINHLKYFIETEFEIYQTGESCWFDLLVRPKSIETDMWLCIQLKTTITRRSQGVATFNNVNKYPNMILVCTLLDECINLVINGSEISSQILSWGTGNSKYNKYQVKNENLSSNLLECYNNNNCMKVVKSEERNYIYNSYVRAFDNNILRKQMFPNLHYENTAYHCMVTDIIINGKKIQDKSGHKVYNSIEYNLKKTKSRAKVPYYQGDNDFYWFITDDPNLFYVIPEAAMIQTGHIETDADYGKGIINLYPIYRHGEMSKNNLIHNKYLFRYDEDTERQLIHLLETGEVFDENS